MTGVLTEVHLPTSRAGCRSRRVGRRDIPSPIQYFLQCSMTADAHPDRGLIVSNACHLIEAGRTLPAAFGSRPPVPLDLADSRPQATACSTSTIANRSVISVDNSSR